MAPARAGAALLFPRPSYGYASCILRAPQCITISVLVGQPGRAPSPPAAGKVWNEFVCVSRPGSALAGPAGVGLLFPPVGRPRVQGRRQTPCRVEPSTTWRPVASSVPLTSPSPSTGCTGRSLFPGNGLIVEPAGLPSAAVLRAG